MTIVLCELNSCSEASLYWSLTPVSMFAISWAQSNPITTIVVTVSVTCRYFFGSVYFKCIWSTPVWCVQYSFLRWPKLFIEPLTARQYTTNWEKKRNRGIASDQNLCSVFLETGKDFGIFQCQDEAKKPATSRKWNTCSFQFTSRPSYFSLFQTFYVFHTVGYTSFIRCEIGIETDVFYQKMASSNDNCDRLSKKKGFFKSKPLGIISSQQRASIKKRRFLNYMQIN